MSEIKEKWLASTALRPMTGALSPTETSDAQDLALRFGYRIGALRLLTPEGALSEVISGPNIYPIPNAPPGLSGYVNRQGTLVPVWDLRVLIDDARTMSDETEHDREKQAVLALGRDERRVGVIISGLPRTLRKLERISEASPPDGLIEFVNGAWSADGFTWLEFDYESFLGAQMSQAAASGRYIA